MQVEQVFSALAKAGITFKPSKCTLFSQAVDYLGHRVTPGRLAVAVKNTEPLAKCAYPETQTDLRSFIGLCIVYRRFVPNFARVAAALNKLLTKGMDKNLPSPNDEQMKSFTMLRDALVSAPILRLPDPNRPFSVDTDACDYQIGATLFQEYEDGRHPVGFWSRSLPPAEKNYSASELECLAVVWAAQILRPYLEGKEFTVYTDNAGLARIFYLTDASNRLARWRLRLQEFDFHIKYRKGAANTVADSISRLPTFGCTNIDTDLDIPCLLVDKSPGDKSTITTTCKIDNSSWIPSDWDPEPPVVGAKLPAEYEVGRVRQQLLNHTPAICTLASGGGGGMSQITINEFCRAQAEDEECKEIAQKIAQGYYTPYTVDD